jgi:FkbM family methyltransferase
MTARDVLARMLDRPVGRGLLASIANLHARRLNGGPALRVFYDGDLHSWGREALGETILDGTRFNYYARDLAITDGMTPWTAVAHRHWFVRYMPRPGDTILDIGAEIGSDVPAFAKGVGKDGRVVAVEAHPVTYKLLEATVARSGFTQVECKLLAITESRGEIFIEDASSTLSSAVSTRGVGHRVPGLSMDELCESLGIGEIGLVKMNIEGSECDALKGMQKTLERTRNLVIACHDFRADDGDGEYFRTRAGVVATLHAAGFEVADPPKNATVYVRDHVHAWRRG